MKTKNLLLLIFSLLTLTTYGQDEKDKHITKGAITELKISSDNLEELKNFDWEGVREMLKDKDQNQKIVLTFAYENDSENGKSKAGISNFELKVTGKNSDVEQMITTLKGLFNKFVEIDKKIENKNE